MKQTLKSSPKVSNTMSLKLQQISTLKDALLENKIAKYWQDLEKTADLHKICLLPIDYQKKPVKYFGWSILLHTI